MTSKEVCFSLRKMAQSQTIRFVNDMNVMFKLGEYGTPRAWL